MNINIPKLNINLNKNLIPAAIVIAGVLVAGAYVYVNFWPNRTLSPQEAAARAMAFIDKNIEQGATATLVWVKEQGSVYQISLKINETPYESYVTKDGKLLFPSGIVLEEPAAVNEQNKNIASESFAKCLTEKGTKFYGAWWCPNCENQKDKFDASFQYIDYIECEKVPGTSRGDMTDTCKAANIVSFPTWDFSGGTRKTGDLSLKTLSELSGCSL